jgi:hypothetical protein
MTCAHVLGLIDAGPLADYPRAHLDAARRHARDCATCAPALRAAEALTAGLEALPRPAAPIDLEAIVMARLARVDGDRRPAEAEPVTGKARTGRPWMIWPVWSTVLGGVAAGLSIVVAMRPIDLASPRVGGIVASLVAMPPMGASAAILAAGLALYVAGLFGSVSSRAHDA